MGLSNTKFGDKLRSESGGDTHIPFTSHVDAHTLRTRDGKLCQIIKLDGVAHETSDTNQLNAWKNARNFLWRSIADNKISLWTHVLRYKKSNYPDGKFEDGFSSELNTEYEKSIEKSELFVNDLYICVVRNKVSSDTVAGMSDSIKSSISRTDIKNVRLAQNKEVKNLDDTTRKILKGLASYNPKRLSVYYRTLKGVLVETVRNDEDRYVDHNIIKITKKDEERQLSEGLLAAYSEPLEFIGYLVNGFWRNIPLGYQHAGKAILATKISFDKEYFTRQSTSGKSHGGVISISEYTNQTAAGMIDGLLSLPLEFVLTQSFTFIGKASAQNLLGLQIKRLNSSGDLSESQIADLYSALDDLTANEFCMGNHHFTVEVTSDTPNNVSEKLAICEAELSEFGLLTARDYLGLEPAFWAKIPGNHSYISRKSPITSKNFASFSSFHNYPQGNLHGNHWGEAVALLKTVSATPYYFNFHYPKDLGNTTVIGPSGAGKTVLMLFLSSMLEKHKPTQIFFDKDRGAEIFIRAQNGSYFAIEAGMETGFNPCQLNDTEKNRKFLRDFISKLVEIPGQKLLAEETEEIAIAVNGNYKLDKKDRRLINLYPFFQHSGANGLKARLKSWVDDGDKSWVFDNKSDTLNLGNRVIGFDVTDFLDDKIIRTPLLMYLFHRVNELIDGRRIAITLDEGWKLLDDEYFGNMFKDWLKVIRKKDGFTVFGTQEPSDVTSSAIGKTILSQSPTQIFLPNPKADYEDYVDGFKLTEREFEIIRSLDVQSRCFIIKQGNNSVVAELNLDGMDNKIAVLSSTTRNVAILKSIRDEVGNDSKDWLPQFYNKRA